MPSSVIRRFAYESDRRELLVEFVSGRRYVYEEVPPGVVDSFRAAFAKGVYFNTRIRDAFRFRDVSGEDPDTLF